LRDERVCHLFDPCIGEQHGNIGEQREPTCGGVRITEGCLVDHELRGHQSVVRSFVCKPLLCLALQDRDCWIAIAGSRLVQAVAWLTMDVSM